MAKKNDNQKEKYFSFDAIFSSLHEEIVAMARKKNEVTLSLNKVKFINARLIDIEEFLKNEPESKYLELLDEDTLPQYSDVVLTLSQYKAALDRFRVRMFRSERE